MVECLNENDGLGKEELLRGEICDTYDDLVVFRWLDSQISNKKAITACLLVLQGSACTGAPPAEGLAEGT